MLFYFYMPNYFQLYYDLYTDLLPSSAGAEESASAPRSQNCHLFHLHPYSSAALCKPEGLKLIQVRPYCMAPTHFVRLMLIAASGQPGIRHAALMEMV